MSPLEKSGRLALTLIIAVASSACGSAAGDSSELGGEPDDESWGEAPLGKADGLSTPPARKALIARFQEPALTDGEREVILGRYSDVDPDGVVPSSLLDRALVYFDVNEDLLENPRWLTVIDFSQHSSQRRLYVVDMDSGSVERHVVAHGSGSDTNDDGHADAFSNVNNSHQSSLGYYLTGETYSGKWGLSLRLDGLSETNDKARSRAIVMHGASYVVDGRSRQGRSWGCPAIPMAHRDALVGRLKEGSLLYADLATD
jgi:hypothetical protein